MSIKPYNLSSRPLKSVGDQVRHSHQECHVKGLANSAKSFGSNEVVVVSVVGVVVVD